MREETVDAVGAQVFSLLVSLLRPVARRRPPAGAPADSKRAPLPPQRTEIHLRRNGFAGSAEIQMWIARAAREPIALAWTLPLPAAAGVASLELEWPGGQEPAGLCERREAREWFDLARRAGLASAILAEDAPGVFGLEVESPGCGSLRLRLRYSWQTSQAADVELALRCEAGEASGEGRSRRAHLLRLGSSHRLDRLVGIVAAAQAAHGFDRAAERRRDGQEEAGAREAAPAWRPDVFASCDKPDGAAAMYRGCLAGRAVRLWADLRSPGGAGVQAGQPQTAAEIARLMAAYRGADRSEAERRDLAAAVARLGLEAGVATLWTSFVAVVGSRDPGGELVFAAA